MRTWSCFIHVKGVVEIRLAVHEGARDEPDMWVTRITFEVGMYIDSGNEVVEKT